MNNPVLELNVIAKLVKSFLVHEIDSKRVTVSVSDSEEIVIRIQDSFSLPYVVDLYRVFGATHSNTRMLESEYRRSEDDVCVYVITMSR